MADSAERRKMNEQEREEDYMGDLSQFLPPDTVQHSKKIPSKHITSGRSLSGEPSSKKSNALSWQERRKIEKERKQIEEDEKTLANIEAPIAESNIGFKMLKQMGYIPGAALGKDGYGRAEPVALDIRRSRAGIGREDPHKEKRKREEIQAENIRRKQDELIVDFGSRKKSQWKSRRIVANFWKAKSALDQLENREVLPEKEDDEEANLDEDEEEELITEEDLHGILTKLRDDHRYCPFCGFQYESAEALQSDCPGINEDDH